MKCVVFVSLLAALLAPGVVGQCGSPGVAGIPQISMSDRVLGNFATFSLTSARPLSPWAVFADLTGGPTVTPFGSFCLGPAPLLLFDAVTGPHPVTDGNGAAHVTRYLDPGLAAVLGLPFHLQAVVVDPAAANNLAISNGLDLVLGAPGLFLVEPAFANPFGGSAAASLHFFDALADQMAWSTSFPNTNAVTALVRDAGRRRMVALQSHGVLWPIDADSGSLGTAGGSVASGPGSANACILDPGNDRLVVSWQGVPPNPFSPGTPGAIQIVDAGTLAVQSNIPLTGTPSRLLHIAGTSIVYVLESGQITPVDTTLGAVLPSIALPATNGQPTDMLDLNGILVVLLAGANPTPFSGGSAPMLAQVNTATHTLLPGSPVALPNVGAATALRVGPSPAGPALVVLQPNIGLLQAVSVATLQPVAGVSVTVGAAHLAQTAGGTEWLLVQSGSPGSFVSGPVPGTLEVIDAATFAPVTSHALPSQAQGHLVVQPSDVLRRAFVTSGSSTLLAGPTDPTTAPVSFITGLSRAPSIVIAR